MAEIKSSIEIALERAAAMAEQADDLAEEEAREAGLILARKVLNAQIAPESLAAELTALPDEQQTLARQAAAEKLLSALMEGNPNTPAAVDNLAAAFGAQDAAGALRAAAHDGAQSMYVVQEELAAEMLQELAANGIHGSAVFPNPLAHPGFQDRLEQATQEAATAMRAAAAAFKRAIAG